MLADEESAEDSKALALVLRYHRHYRAGFLPRAGGIAEQPWFLLECIEEAEAAFNEHEALRMQELRDRAAQNPQTGGRRARVVGRLDPEDDGPGWRGRIKPL